MDDVREIARRAGVDLLILFGSRARGDARTGSDWDFAYSMRGGSRAGGAFDPDALLADLVLALGSDRIDLVDLAQGSALLRFRVAVEGKPLYEGTPDAFRDFQIESSLFWCDVAPVLQASYATVLAGLNRP